MVQVLSKLRPIDVSCIDYVHPWTTSCPEATAGLYLYAVKDCLRIYGTVYILALLMKGKIPKTEDLKRTLAGIIQSSAFLSATGFGYSAFLCFLRRLLGNFNYLTVSFIPVFLSSAFAIFIERPSRRVLLCLYVSNVATETIWNMLAVRGMVRNVPHAPTLIFSASVAVLLLFYKGGLHRRDGAKMDSVYSALRFVVGPYEEFQYVQRRSEQATLPGASNTGAVPRTTDRPPRRYKYPVFRLIDRALRIYKKLIHMVKCSGRNALCPHPFSCSYYVLQGSVKMFGVGLAIQTAVKLVFNVQRIFTKPSTLKTIFKRDLFSLATFLAGFTGTFRLMCCLLRYMRAKDSPYHALISGFVAGSFFSRYSDTTISLYMMWKVLQLTYSMGMERGLLPRVPYFTEFLYCFSTGMLFHAGALEPLTLRPSYWKFLHSISGGRISCMDRTALNAWGLNSTQQLQDVLKNTKTVAELKHIFKL